MNPTADSILGEKCYATLSDVRVLSAIPAGANRREQGRVNEEAEKIAREGGLDGVMDACAKVVHMRVTASRAGRSR